MAAASQSSCVPSRKKPIRRPRDQRATLIGLGYAALSSPELGYLAACAALFVAYVRATGKATGTEQEFCGPFAKPQRMFVVTVCALWCVVFAVVAVIDIETHFIPDVIILPATGLALAASLVDPRLTWRAALLGALAGLVSFYAIAWVARGGFGLGDVKLAAFVGAVTGLVPVFYALIAGIIAGGIGALLLLVTRRMERRSFMPYGPYLCLGGWLGLLPAMLRFWGLPL